MPLETAKVKFSEVDDRYNVSFRTGNGTGFMPALKAVVSDSKRCITTFSDDNVSSDALTSGRTQTIKIDPQSLKKVVACTLELEINESGSSNSITLPHIAATIDRMELVAASGSGDEIWRAYDDNLFLNSYFKKSHEQVSKWIEYAGLNEDYGENGLVNAGTTRYFNLPLDASWFDNTRPYMPGIRGDLWLKIYFKSTSTVSGSGTVALNGLRLIVEQDCHSKDEVMRHNQVHTAFNIHDRYSEPIRIEDTSTWTASTEKKISLEDVVGKAGFLVFGVRSSKATTSNAYQKWIGLGNNAGTVDLIDAQGKSYFGNGTPVRLQYLKQLASEILPNCNYIQQHPVYVLPFGDVQQSVKGRVAGYHEFDGSKWKLSITPGAAATDAIFSVNLNNAANDGGYYKLTWGGETTDSIVYNAAVGVMKTAFEALPMFKKYPNMTATFSATAATDFTITISGVDFDVNAKWGLPKLISESLNDGTVAEYATTTNSTAFASGITETGTLITSVYVYITKESVKLQNGRLSIHNL